MGGGGEQVGDLPRRRRSRRGSPCRRWPARAAAPARRPGRRPAPPRHEHPDARPPRQPGPARPNPPNTRSMVSGWGRIARPVGSRRHPTAASTSCPAWVTQVVISTRVTHPDSTAAAHNPRITGNWWRTPRLLRGSGTAAKHPNRSASAPSMPTHPPSTPTACSAVDPAAPTETTGTTGTTGVTDSPGNGATNQTQDLRQPRVLPGLRCPDPPTRRTGTRFLITTGYPRPAAAGCGPQPPHDDDIPRSARPSRSVTSPASIGSDPSPGGRSAPTPAKPTTGGPGTRTGYLIATPRHQPVRDRSPPNHPAHPTTRDPHRDPPRRHPTPHAPDLHKRLCASP